MKERVVNIGMKCCILRIGERERTGMEGGRGKERHIWPYLKGGGLSADGDPCVSISVSVSVLGRWF